MKKKLISFLILACFSMGMFMVAESVNADIGSQIKSPEFNEVADKVYNENPSGDVITTSVQDIIAYVINSVLGLLGVIFLVLIIYAGFLWMTATGNDEQVTKAKNILTRSIIGVIIIVAAYAISFFVLSAVTSIGRSS